MSRRFIVSVGLSSLLVMPPFAADAAEPPRPLAPGEIRLRLDKLRVVGSVLYVAAHPDDENTTLLAALANGRLVRTAYLSLTRGDGGQNLIGSEQGAALGVIRTHELLAARRIDGAEQIFTRARDFGFSKGPDETLRIWGRDEVLADVVWAIRQFRPDVIVNRFSTEAGEGHGHHTASARLAVDAFRAAADPKFRPEQLAYVKPWQARRLFWNRSSFGASANRPEPPGLVKMDVGGFSPLLGQSFGEIAARSRSMHKSQGFGAAARRGPIVETFELLAGDAPPPNHPDGILAGLDLSWRRVPGGERVADRLAKAAGAFSVDAPEAVIPFLVDADAALDAVTDEPWRAHTRRELRELVAACAGLHLEAIAAEPTAVRGGPLEVTATAINRSKAALALSEVRVTAGGPAKVGKPLARNQPEAVKRSVTVRAQQPLSTPYWLAEPPGEGLFRTADQQLVGRPLNDPAIEATFVISAGGRDLTFTRPIVYKWTDPVEGERYRPLAIVPPLSVTPDNQVLMFVDRKPRALRLALKARAAKVNGTVRLEPPAGYTVEPAQAPVSLDGKDAETELVFAVRRVGNAAGGTLRIVADTGAGGGQARSVTTISHRHIPTQVILSDAAVRLVPASLRRAGDRIGYVPGAGDEVAASLRNVGYEVTVLDDEALASGDLRRFHAIVLGVRAYNVNPRLAALRPRLMRYVEEGGVVLVQYNTQNRLSQVAAEIGPHPFAISRERVTDESAPVTFALPGHETLRVPNAITAADFEGWVQERGLYFAGTWDPRYEAVLAMNDPGEPPRKGSVLVARHGRGRFVYTGLAFFRQLPAGVPGAYRLLANLIARPRG